MNDDNYYKTKIGVLMQNNKVLKSIVKDCKQEIKELNRELKMKDLIIERKRGLKECGFCEVEMVGHWKNCAVTNFYSRNPNVSLDSNQQNSLGGHQTVQPLVEDKFHTFHHTS